MSMNVLQYAALAEANWKKNLGNMSDFQPKYTFYNDFSIADFCEAKMADKDAVKKTYENVVKSWGNNIKAMTEVVMVLNHKIWSFYGKVDSSYMGVSEDWRNKFIETYQSLYEKAVDFVEKTYADDKEALSYYYEVTD